MTAERARFAEKYQAALRAAGAVGALEYDARAFALNNFDCGRLLLTEVIARLELRGDPVVLAPYRDVLLITGDDDESGRARIAATARPLLDDPSWVSGFALVYRGGSWREYEPPPGHPSEHAFRMMARLTPVKDYGQQKELLQARGDDVFVASYSIYEHRDTGIVQSSATWTKDVVTLLPRTDSVVFVSTSTGARGPVSVPWERAMAVLGPTTQPAGLTPERYLVKTFPRADELAKMAA